MLRMPPFPGRPVSPATPGVVEWVEEGITAPSAHCDVASPFKGTTLRQRLDPLGCVDLVGLATDVPLWGVCNSAAGGLPAAVSSAAETAGGNPPSMRAHALVRARSPVSCARYSACLGKSRSIILLVTASRELTSFSESRCYTSHENSRYADQPNENASTRPRAWVR